jgi:hypothetical protein
MNAAPNKTECPHSHMQRLEYLLILMAGQTHSRFNSSYIFALWQSKHLSTEHTFGTLLTPTLNPFIFNIHKILKLREHIVLLHRCSSQIKMISVLAKDDPSFQICIPGAYFVCFFQSPMSVHLCFIAVAPRIRSALINRDHAELLQVLQQGARRGYGMQPTICARVYVRCCWKIGMGVAVDLMFYIAHLSMTWWLNAIHIDNMRAVALAWLNNKFPFWLQTELHSRSGRCHFNIMRA